MAIANSLFQKSSDEQVKLQQELNKKNSQIKILNEQLASMNKKNEKKADVPIKEAKLLIPKNENTYDDFILYANDVHNLALELEPIKNREAMSKLTDFNQTKANMLIDREFSGTRGDEKIASELIKYGLTHVAQRRYLLLFLNDKTARDAMNLVWNNRIEHTEFFYKLERLIYLPTRTREDVVKAILEKVKPSKQDVLDAAISVAGSNYFN